MDQRKLARLLKAVIDRLNQVEVEALVQPFSVGVRDRLANDAATRLFRQRLTSNNLPSVIANAASRLPIVATEITSQSEKESKQRPDRIDTRQLRVARDAGSLEGIHNPSLGLSGSAH